MNRILILTMTVLLSLLFLTACAPDAAPLPTRASLAELDAVTAQPETGETAVPPAATPPSSTQEKTESGNLPALPDLAAIPAQSELSGGADNNITIAEGTEAADAATLFGAAAFALNAPLPTGVTEAQVWQQPALPLDEDRAKAIAARWGFTGPLYQFAPPAETCGSWSRCRPTARQSAGIPRF